MDEGLLLFLGHGLRASMTFTSSFIGLALYELATLITSTAEIMAKHISCTLVVGIVVVFRSC